MFEFLTLKGAFFMRGPISTKSRQTYRDQTFHIVLGPKLILYEFRSIIQVLSPAAIHLKYGFFGIFYWKF